MTTQVIQGVEYLVVPSSSCSSTSGSIQCSQFNTHIECSTLRCTSPAICFITKEQYPEWLKAKLIGDTNAAQ